MKNYKIAVIAGDGIGPEVIAEGVRVLEHVAKLDGGFNFEFTHFPWGCEYYLKTGKMMPDDAIETLKEFDAVYLGAVGYPGVPDHISLWDLLLKIRHEFDEYVNVRPVKLLKGVLELADDYCGGGAPQEYNGVLNLFFRGKIVLQCQIPVGTQRIGFG